MNMTYLGPPQILLHHFRHFWWVFIRPQALLTLQLMADPSNECAGFYFLVLIGKNRAFPQDAPINTSSQIIPKSNLWWDIGGLWRTTDFRIKIPKKSAIFWLTQSYHLKTSHETRRKFFLALFFSSRLIYLSMTAEWF